MPPLLPDGMEDFVEQVVPVLQNVSLLPVVASQNMSTRPSVPTSTEAEAVSLMALPAPTMDGTSVLRVTPSLVGIAAVRPRDCCGTLGDTAG